MLTKKISEYCSSKNIHLLFPSKTMVPWNRIHRLSEESQVWKHTHKKLIYYFKKTNINNGTDVSDKNLGYGFLAGMVLPGFLVL